MSATEVGRVERGPSAQALRRVDGRTGEAIGLSADEQPHSGTKNSGS